MDEEEVARRLEQDGEGFRDEADRLDYESGLRRLFRELDIEV